MEKKYLITVKDIHETEEEKYSSELSVLGSFTTENGTCAVTYTETDPTLDGCETTVKFFGENKVEVTRTGTYGTALILESGRRHTCLYSTPFGDLSVGIFTHFIKTSFTEKGGEASFCYTLNFGGGEETKNTLSLLIREANK